MTTKAVTYLPDEEIALPVGEERGDARRRGRRASGDRHRREAGRGDPRAVATTNGRLAVRASGSWSGAPARRLVDLAEGSEEKRITFADTQARPVPVITSPEWSGSETGGRRYAPFTVNVERSKPWHTLTGRMHFLLDHDWMHEMGETLPIFRVPLDMTGCSPSRRSATADGRRSVTVRYLTPHSKWSIHSEYQDNLFMLSLSRGGPVGLDEPRRRRRDRRARQRLGRGGQPQRHDGAARDRQPPHAHAAPCSSTTPRSAW